MWKSFSSLIISKAQRNFLWLEEGFGTHSCYIKIELDQWFEG